MGKKTQNGLYLFDQWWKSMKRLSSTWTQSIVLWKNKLFRGMEFIDHVDTSLWLKDLSPIFINETLSDIYGDNKLQSKRE
jgi:hypothetical protein